VLKTLIKPPNLAAMLVVAAVALVASMCSPVYAAPAQSNVFRLGTAGLPYGWSTAIGDFDADKKPDFAIANKIGTSSRGYEYSVELDLSLRSRQVFRFHSPDSALSIVALDLDNDHDLDLVLTRSLNGEVVGVWLNDGQGQFYEEARLGYSIPVFSVSGTVLPAPTASLLVAGSPVRRVVPFPSERVQIEENSKTNREKISSLDQHSRVISPRFIISSRAPPASPSV
jgi:hypothetical protein